MADIRLRQSAERDFIDIGHYTRLRGSESQAEIYLQTVLDVLRQIGDQPFSGQGAGRALAGYRCRRAGAHLIFYVVSADGSVEIVRILHEKTDVSRYLDDKQ